MAALTLVDPRLALVLLAALILASAVPLAIAWTRLLPEDAPPFAPAGRPFNTKPYSQTPKTAARSVFAAALLLLVTVSFAVQFPGVPRDIGLNELPLRVPVNSAEWLALAMPGAFALLPVLAIIYAIARPSFIRVPLLAAGMALVLLWLVGPWLYAALAAR